MINQRLDLCIFLLFLVLLSSCGGGDDPTTPQVQPEPEDTLLASADIGSSGGILEEDRIRIEVPTGAFAETTQLQLYAVADTTEAPGEGPLFQVTGIPTVFDQPLTLNFPMDPTSTKGPPQPAIFLVGEYLNPTSTPGSQWMYRPVQAQPINGHWQIVLPRNALEPGQAPAVKNPDESLWVRFQRLKGVFCPEFGSRQVPPFLRRNPGISARPGVCRLHP